jgi:hypothetical protein
MEKFPINENMALLTAPEISDNANLYLADFRDQTALVYQPTGHFLGITKSMQIKFAKRPFRMIGGVWFCDEDKNLQNEHNNVRLSSKLLSFGPINP